MSLFRKPSTRVKALYAGAKLTSGDRDVEYGDPVTNMQDIGAMWATYLYNKYGGVVLDPMQFQLSGEDVAHMLTLMKIARTFNGVPKFDTYVDSATYQAIAAECAEAEAEENIPEMEVND